MAAKKKPSLVDNINKRKRAGTSRPKSRSTVSRASYDAMEAGWPKGGTGAKKGAAKKRPAKKRAAKRTTAKKRVVAKKGARHSRAEPAKKRRARPKATG